MPVTGRGQGGKTAVNIYVTNAKRGGDMALLQKAELEMAYAKIGILGFSGSGKTHTACLIAIGLAKLIEAKQVAFYDTETGSDWVIEMFEKENIEMMRAKTRSFSDLVAIRKECISSKIPILLVDSITHPWRDLMESYKKKKDIRKIAFHHWDDIKGEWDKQWASPFLNTPLHIIICGRAGFEYDYDFDEEGNKDLVKTGTKMKTESEFGFEPSLVIEMERTTKAKEELLEISRQAERNKKKKQEKQAFTPSIGSHWIHRAHVLKDRSRRLDGQVFDDPTFEAFYPHVEFLNLGGEHFGFDPERDSQDRFDSEGRPDWKVRKAKKEIYLEEIQGVMVSLWPGADKDSKKTKADFTDLVFNTRSWKAVETMSPEELEPIKKKVRLFEDLYNAKSEEMTMEDVWNEANRTTSPIEQEEIPH